ncbi:MAG TPA: hypothetical protein VFS56_06620 [Gemmatimonadaceae bacterium]|nr:hypothetical protein [Gemmatimonadaceae bacterium]
MRRFLVAATLFFASAASAQKAHDPSAQLRAVLPAKVAEHVLATIADARARSLPATALEQQALRLARSGAMPAYIERSIDRRARNMRAAKAALAKRGRKPTNNEVVAGAELLGKGVSVKQVSTWAKAAPSGRDLTVPMNVTASLMDRGLRSDAALARVHERMVQRHSDRQLIADARGKSVEHRPPTANKAGGLSHRPVTPGPGTKPVTPARPVTPGRNG